MFLSSLPRRARGLCAASALAVAASLAPVVGAFAAPKDAKPPAAPTSAPFAYLYDVTSDATLYAAKADMPTPPASMATLMTLELVFKALKEGRLSRDQTFRVTEDAWRRGGAPSRNSTMFAKLNSEVAVADLLRGVIVQSGTDAAITLATGLAGSEQSFVGLMNQRAKELGLVYSTFRNATGQPDPEQKMSARDVAKLAAHLIDTYPEYYRIFAEPEFTWSKITQRNRNPLLADYQGADGLKTGYTEDSGFGLVGSVTRDSRRLIIVINGVETAKQRAEEARKLLDWGFNAFEQRRLFEGDDAVAEARVFGGSAMHVALVAQKPVDLLAPKGDDARVVARVTYDGPIAAPVAKGQRIGTLKVWRGAMLTVETPVYAANDVPVGDLTRRAIDGALELVSGFVGQVAEKI